MEEHPNVTAVRSLLEAFDDFDLERVKEGLAEDIKWHMIGGETAEGWEGMTAMMPADDESFKINADVHDIVGNDEHVIALVNARAEVGDQVFEYRTAEIMHVEDGKITERWAFSDDTAAINEFFGQFS